MKKVLKKLFLRVSLLLHPGLFVQWWKRWRARPVIDWIHAANYFRSGDFHSAAKYYQKGMERHSNHRAYYFASFDYAYCLFRLGRSEEAEEILEKIVSQGIKLRDAYLLLASLLYSGGKEIEAIAVLRKATSLFPGDAKILATFAHTMMTFDAMSDEMPSIKGMLETLHEQLPIESPHRILLDGALARFEVLRGDIEIGEGMVSRVLATGQPLVDVILVRGEKLLERGRILLAREQFLRAMQIVPLDPRPAMLLATAYLNQGEFSDPQKAVQLSILCCNLSRWNNVTYLRLLAEAHSEAGDIDAASLVDARANVLALTGDIKIENIKEVGDQVERLRMLN